jgi:anti-anti-sigma factor
MSCKFGCSSANDGVIIHVDGRFDFYARHEFTSISREALDAPHVKNITVNLSGVKYLDSAALGMLLLLRDKCTSRKKEITLAKPSAHVAETLKIVNFDKLFRVLHA